MPTWSPADGSVDLFFGPTPPQGESNWVQTMPGKHWFSYFRFYGPLEEYSIAAGSSGTFHLANGRIAQELVSRRPPRSPCPEDALLRYGVSAEG
jgi:hypothetical protein